MNIPKHVIEHSALGVSKDHGALSGLTDDDHTQYQKESEKGAVSGYASLSAGTLVVENPANATATPTASKIPIADGSGLLDSWVSTPLAPQGMRVTGLYYGSYIGNVATATNTKNILRVSPFLVVLDTESFDRISIRFSSTIATSVGRLGIYTWDAQSDRPDELLVDSGEQDWGTSGLKETVIDVTLTAGYYGMASLGGTAQPAVYTWGEGNSGGCFIGNPTPASTFERLSGITIAQAYGALPNPFPAGALTYVTSTIPVVWLRRV